MIRPAGTDPTWVPYAMTNRDLTDNLIKINNQLSYNAIEYLGYHEFTVDVELSQSIVSTIFVNTFSDVAQPALHTGCIVMVSNTGHLILVSKFESTHISFSIENNKLRIQCVAGYPYGVWASYMIMTGRSTN